MDETKPVVIPPTNEIVERLGAVSREAVILRQLLKLAQRRDRMNGTAQPGNPSAASHA